tara:strand:- start:81 stop:779 length:699 start_codon:yes stop_codon:yes gene_type:complete
MIQYNYIFGGIISTLALIIFDKTLPKKLKGKYYLSHAIINFLILLNCTKDMISSYTDFDNSIKSETNFIPTMLVYSLHFYHMISYNKKLRFDDWLHHILMVLVALPLSSLILTGSLLNHSLFFLCGLPGMIDYILLFLVRNNIIDKMTEKYINKQINLWIRAPGCIAHSALSILAYFKNKDSNVATKYDFIVILITTALVYWNGIYFMEQVVSDYKKNEIKNEMKNEIKNKN